MKRTLFIALTLALGILASGAGFGIATPTAEVTRFQIESISLRDVTFLFELSVKNPYPIDLPVDGLSLDFSVEGSKVFSAASKGGFTVKANATKANSFTVTLAYEAVIKLVKDYVAKEWLATRIDAKLVIKLPKTIPGLPSELPFSFKFEKKIPAIKPVVAIADFKVVPPTVEQIAKAMGSSAVDPAKAAGMFKDILAGRKPAAPVIDPASIDVPVTVSFTIEIKNEAKAALGFAKLGYELFVNGERLVAGETAAVRTEGSRTFVTVNNTFSSKKLSKAVSALFADRKGTFEVRGSATIKLPDEIRKEPVPLAFAEKGSFSIK